MDLKGALGAKLGGVPAWIWGVVIAGAVVGYAYLSGGSDGPTTAPDAGPSYVDSGGAADAGDVPGTPSLTENTVPLTTNPAWKRVVTDRLVAGGMDPLQVGNALSKGLAGLTLTAQEAAIWNEAVRRFGDPPEGNPPITVETGQPSTPDQPAPGNPQPQYSPQFTLSVAAGGSVEGFTTAIRARIGRDVEWSLLEATNPSLAGNVNWGPSGSKNYGARTFKNGATYTIPSIRLG